LKGYVSPDYQPSIHPPRGYAMRNYRPSNLPTSYAMPPECYVLPAHYATLRHYVLPERSYALPPYCGQPRHP
jgi:hypothetical protein